MTKKTREGAGGGAVPRGRRVGNSKTGPQLRKESARAWTVAKRGAFLSELAATCNVRASADAAGMSVSAVYGLRMRDARFRAQWREALREGYAKLELMLIDRAMNGSVKTVTRAGGAVDKTHEYPNGLAFQLLKMHREEAQVADSEHDPDEIEEVRRRIARKLDALRRRIEAEQADEAGEGE
jgi:hypothetical protein